MLKRIYQYGVFLLPFTAHASFIESTVGTAIVNDATAAYFNPAALALVKNNQFVALGSTGQTDTQFSGIARQVNTNTIQSGTTPNRLSYLFPSGYYAMPLKSKWRLGFAVVANDLNRDADSFSLLRYSESSSKIENVDLVPAIAYKFNDFIALGAAFYASRAHFLLRPVSGIPSLDIPDAESLNDSAAATYGGDVGLLLRPTKTTLIGVNYRSSLTYKMRGSSTFTGIPSFSSNNYRFDYWIPARTAVSVSHFFNSKFALIGTVHYIQWNIFKVATVYNAATAAGIISSASIPYYFHNAWLFTGGMNYHLSKKWTFRLAGSHLQSPSQGKFRVDHGDNITIGTSIAYVLNKSLTLNAGYAHAFLQPKTISILNARNAIDGRDKGTVNAFSLKLIFSF